MSNGKSRSDAHDPPRVTFIDAWEVHRRRVHRSCFQRMRSRDDADEAYSRTAVNAFQHWPDHIDDLERAGKWLLTVARNVCTDIFREHRSRREISLESEVTKDGTAIDSAAGLGIDPEVSYGARQEMLCVLRCLQRLPFRLRRPAELHFIHELPYRDIARQLEISEANVRKRIQQAKDKLRRAVAVPALPNSAAKWGEEDLGEASAPLSLFTAVVETNNGAARDAVIALPLGRVATVRQIAALQQYTRAHPRGWRKQLELARALVSAGAWRDAVLHYRNMLPKQPFRLQPYLELGAVLEALGSQHDAAALYAEGAMRMGGNADRMLLRARAEVLRIGFRQAWPIVREVAPAQDRDAARQLRTCGEIALAHGYIVEAIRAFERCLVLDAADPLARIHCHDALLAAGRPLAARKQLTEAVRQGNTGTLAFERLIAASCRARTATDEPVERWLDALRRAAPSRVSTHAAIAQILLAKGCGRDAESAMRASVSANRNHAGAWLWLAQIQGAVGAIHAAVRAGFRSISLDPSNREAWLMTGELARQLRNRSVASSLSHRIAVLFPDDPLLLAEAGLLAASAGSAREGASLCAAARTIEPELPRLYLAHGEALAAAADDSNAIAALAEGWELLPLMDGHEDAAQTALVLAGCHGRLGHVFEQRTWVRVALLRAKALEETDPPRSFFLRGEALVAMRSYTDALIAYREAAARHLPHPWRSSMKASVRRIAFQNSQDRSIFRSVE